MSRKHTIAHLVITVLFAGLVAYDVAIGRSALWAAFDGFFLCANICWTINAITDGDAE